MQYLLPPREEEDSLLEESGVLNGTDPSSSPQTASTLRHLLNETADLIESPSFTQVLTLLNNEGFATLVEQNCARDAFKSESTPQSFTSFAIGGAAEVKTKLANVLAVMARQAHVIGNGANPPNEYLSNMDQNVRELEAFAAVVYSSNFNVDLLRSGQQTEALRANMPSPDASLAPVMVDREEAIQGGPEEVENAALAAPVTTEAGPGGGETAFERAWGKAVVEDRARGQV